MCVGGWGGEGTGPPTPLILLPWFRARRKNGGELEKSLHPVFILTTQMEIVLNDMYCMDMDYILAEIKQVFKNLKRYAIQKTLKQKT